MIDKRLQSAIEKAEDRKLRSKKSEQRKKEFEQCIAQTFATPEGKRVLLWLMEVCGFQKSNITSFDMNGQLSDKMILWNESRRDVYLRLREKLKTRPDILASVEIHKLGEEDGK